MPRDFAHRGNGGRQTVAPATPGWVWMVAGIAMGFAGAVVYYIVRPATPGAPTAAAASTAAETTSNGQRKIAVPPKEPSRFTFYELLPSYEVVIPKEALRPVDPKTPPPDPATRTANGTLFMIQVGAFRERREADGLRARLALLGIESRVEQVTIDNNQTWFRVRIGPERDMARVHSMLAQLEENDIRALVMRLPQ
jgi:cell division protein FtsN